MQRRNAVWYDYWLFSQDERRLFLSLHVNIKPTIKQSTNHKVKTLEFVLTDDSGSRCQVCKTSVLHTLGYVTDKAVFSLINSMNSASIRPPRETCGNTGGSNKLNVIPIDDHIMSYHPAISHYRRLHAPNRLYLPNNITIRSMYKDFKILNPDYLCSYESYRSRVKAQNISFTKLGEEECAKCQEHSYLSCHLMQSLEGVETADASVAAPQVADTSMNASIIANANNVAPIKVINAIVIKPLSNDNMPIDHVCRDCKVIVPCNKCQNWEHHILRAKQARHCYQVDSQANACENVVIRSVDMQKIVMLPHLPGNKTALFQKHIVAYH